MVDKKKQETIDIYQQRYIEHQQHKKEQLSSSYGEIMKKNDKEMKNVYFNLLKNRRSQRIFNSKDISEENLNFILKCITEAPSSCNRQSINIRIIKERNLKEILSGLLVGGVGWCQRANIILLIFADQDAYKEKLDFMPYLDSGVQIMNTYLACESINIGCCYINPNVRKENKKIFQEKFGNRIFCGALGIGYYDKKSKYSKKKSIKDLVL
jgi:nitroreductase